MIFEDYQFLNTLSNDELRTYIKEFKRDNFSNYLCRSALMLSASNLKHLNKLDELKSDIVIVNLEDGVSEELKPKALRYAAVFISHLKKSNSKVIVRVNPLSSKFIEDELAILNQVKPDAIRFPKVESRNDIYKILDLVSTDIDIDLSIETKEALSNLTTFNFSNRIKRVYLGILDLLESMELSQNILKIGNSTIDYILSKFLIDSKVAGLTPISFVYQDYKNLDEFRKWCEYEKELGFDGKGCISPKQVEIANSVFNLSDNLIERAKYIEEIFLKMKSQGVTGFSDDKYGFIDEPIYKDALNILKKVNYSR